MATITISRQLGSLGSEVGRQAARRLGYQVVGRDVINQAAHKAGHPEMALAAIDELGLLGIKPSAGQHAAYQQAVEEIMLSLAAKGKVVIIGRAGQVILRDRPDVLHVKVIAPVHLRAARTALRQRISLEAAQAQVEASDRTRRRYLRRHYHARWDDPELYDLIINTARLTPAAAADLVCNAIVTLPARAAPQP